MRRDWLFAIFFFVAFCFLLFQFYLILRDFLAPLSYAALLAFMFYPVHRRLRALLQGRDALAASIMTAAVILLVVVPAFYLLTVITTQSVLLYQRISELVSTGQLHQLLDALRASRIGQLWSQIGPGLDALKIDVPDFAVRASQTVSTFLVAQAPAAAANVVRVVLRFLFTVFALFFFFRDGERMIRAVIDLIPMEPANKGAVVQRFAETLQAVVLGSALTAVAQGLLGGIAYWALDVPFALLLAAGTSFFSLLPYGGPVVWLAVAVYLAIVGDYWRALSMFAWGTIVISTADNIIRPLVIGGRTQIPTVFLFFGILGGLQVYGFIGVFLAPAVLATLIAFVRIYREQYAPGAERPIVVP